MKISDLLDSTYFDIDAEPYCHICGNNKFTLKINSSRFRLRDGRVDARDVDSLARLMINIVQIDGLICSRCGNEFIYKKELHHEYNL